MVGYGDVCKWLERALQALARREAVVKARQRIDCGAVKLSSMGAIWNGTVQLAAEKTYTTVGGRFAFVITLFDTANSVPVAVLQGESLTRLRTAAMTAIAVARGARRMHKLALFGAGQQGRAHAEALTAILPFETIDVVDVVDVSDWCCDIGQQRGISVRQSDADHALRDADVVVTTTRAKSPLFDGNCLMPGAFVAAVGTSLPGGSELDAATLRRAARVIVEWKPQSLLEAGEIEFGRNAGVLDDGRIVDLAELYAGHAAWRTHDDEIVVFKSVGFGLSDLAAAAAVWQSFTGRQP